MNGLEAPYAEDQAPESYLQQRKEIVTEKADLLKFSFNRLRMAGSWTLSDRLKWLENLETIVKLREADILKAVSLDKGRSEFAVLLTEFAPTLALIGDYKKTARKVLSPENRSRPFSLNWGNKKTLVYKEPHGVCGVISPSNYPFSLAMGPVITALLAGNAILLKPAPGTLRTNEIVKEIITQSLQLSGLMRSSAEEDSDIIFASLLETTDYGKELVLCPIVQKIHFTGSVKAGLEVLKANASVRFTPPTLELGGSNAAIVLEDADIEEAVRVIIWSRFVAMSCNNIKRVFAVREAFDRLCFEIEIAMPYLEPHETSEGCSKNDEEKYESLLQECKGYSRFVLQVMKFSGPQFSSALKPALIKIRVPSEIIRLGILEEETFVPILPIVRVESEAEAIRLAENTKFGLGTTVFTKNREKFEKLSEKLNCGGVFHNDAMTEFAIPGVPFGGRKNSGSGYSHGPEGLEEFIWKKPVIAEKWHAPKLHLFPWTKSKMKWLKRFLKLIVKLS